MLRFKQIQHDSLLQAQVGPLKQHLEVFKALIIRIIKALLRLRGRYIAEE